jgi:HSP20 family molecular chaperone IbpA
MSLFNTLFPSLNRTPSETQANEATATAPTVKPLYEIKENDDAYGLTVYVPGAAKENLEITAEEGQFRIFAPRAWKQPQGWTALYRESTDAAYELVLAHDNLIDADKVVAELKDGVLRISLPKHEAAKPRKIAVS